MITARNYAAQAERDLRVYSKRCQEVSFQKDSSSALAMAETIKKSVHFAVPDNACIFEDDFKGIRGKNVRLPYPSITVEYYLSYPVGSMDLQAGKMSARKRIVIASEMTSSQIAKLGERKLADVAFSSDYWIGVCSAVFFQHINKWTPDPAVVIFPCQGWDTHNKQKIGTQYNSELLSFQGHSLLVFTDVINHNFPHGLSEEVRDSLSWEAAMEVGALLEFLEALSCSNITTGTLPQPSQSSIQKRFKSGKLPLYETKILVLETPKTISSQGEGSGGTHASPRQHLRRGHIRRLPSGNIWVNSCVVGEASKGIINKSYAIKKENDYDNNEKS